MRRRAFYEDEVPNAEYHLTINFLEQRVEGRCTGYVSYFHQQLNNFLHKLLEKYNLTPRRMIRDDEVNSILDTGAKRTRQNRTSELKRKIEDACPDSLVITHVNNGITSGLKVKQTKPIRIISPRATSDFSSDIQPDEQEKVRATILFPYLHEASGCLAAHQLLQESLHQYR
jgi:hypothetical protein